MSYEELQERLSEFGLDTSEAKLYASLLKTGPLKVADLARVSGFNRVQAYRILQRLESRGIVETTLEKPMKFVAAKPDVAFDILAKTLREKINLIEDEKNHFNDLPQMEQSPHLEAEKFRVIRGRPEFFGTLRHLLDSVDSEVMFMTTRNGINRFYHSGLDDVLKPKAKKGMKVRILAEVDKSNLEAVKWLAKSFNIRHSVERRTAQFMIVDNSQIVLSTALDDSSSMNSETDTSLWTNSKDHVSAITGLFDELWRDSIDVQTAIRASVDGAPIPQTQILRGKDEVARMQRELVRNSNKPILAMIPLGRVKMWLREPNLSSLKKAEERNVPFRLMTSMSSSGVEVLKKIDQFSDLRIVDFEVTVESLISDAGVLVISGSSEDSEQSAFWTNERAYITTQERFLNQLWLQAKMAGDIIPFFEKEDQLKQGINDLAKALKQDGWNVSTPGTLLGSSMVEHSYTLIANKGRGHSKTTIALDTVVSDKAIEIPKVIYYASKKADCKPARTFLLVSPSVEDQGRKIASFYGINMLVGEDVDELLEKVRGSLGLKEMKVVITSRKKRS